MVEPIDILIVASDLRAEAWRRVQVASAMNQSPESIRAYDSEKMEWMIANQDYNEVEVYAMGLRA